MVRSLFFTLFVLASVGCPAEPETLVEEPPVAIYEEPVPIEVDDWMVGFLASTSDDVVGEAIESGDFELPDDGTDDDGTTWHDIAPGENGSIGAYNASYFYAVGDLDARLSEGDRVIARSSGTIATYVGSVRQPGYFYGDRRPPTGWRRWCSPGHGHGRSRRPATRPQPTSPTRPGAAPSRSRPPGCRRPRGTSRGSACCRRASPWR